MTDILLVFLLISLETWLVNKLARWMVYRKLALPLREPYCRIVDYGDIEHGKWPIFESKDGTARWSAKGMKPGQGIWISR